MIPLTFSWDGECMKPLRGFARVADRQFVVGENYTMEVVQQRSSPSHRHYFACINEAFANLPESQAGRFASPDHLRKWALIRAGFRQETKYVAQSKAEALRFGSFLRSLDEFALVDVSGKVATLYTAKSQSYAEMSRKEFQQSKDAVLDVIAQLINVSKDELTASAGKAA